MPPIALIVNDEPATSAQLAALVGELGFEAVVSSTGAGALIHVAAKPPDVILLDLTLPDATGFEICHKLKCDRETNLIPIVLVALKDDPRQMLSGVRVGSNGYISKPYTSDEVKEAIDSAIAWRHERIEHGDSGEIVFMLRSEMSILQQTNDMLTDLFSHTPLTERQIKELKQVLTEMGGNAIEWGHRRNADLPLKITYRIGSDQVTLIIRDQGPGFDPKNLPHAACDEDPIQHLDVRNELGIREGGFGIMLAKGMVDEFKYNDIGNQVTLVKRFAKQG
ncbi:MAG: ATP-binding protein [Planctomycetota bacterium]|nr:ATP-binding protein [Planctomycetota bacterium]RLT12236.1 MAG: response regulator [Planctomycetota bacterium]